MRAFSVYGAAVVGAFIFAAVPAGFASSQPMSLTAAVVSNGWPIKRFVLNDTGAVVFAGGDFQGSADGIVFSAPSRFYRLANLGYEPPGSPGMVFAGFPGRYFGDLALNRAGDVVFSASMVACASYDLESCLRTSPRLNGLFRIHNDQGSRIVVEGDSVPDHPGYLFRSFDRIWLNTGSDIAFRGHVYDPAKPSESVAGLFVYSAGRLQTVALVETTPRRPRTDVNSPGFELTIDDEANVVFFSPLAGAVCRYSGGVLSTVLSAGASLGPAETLTSLHEAVPNRNGDIAFHASFGPEPAQQGIYLMRRDGSIERLLADGDATPAGGRFALWREETDRFGYKHQVMVGTSLQLNDSGMVLFVTPVREGPTSAGLFSYRKGEISTVAADGDPRPDDPRQRISFGFQGQDISFLLNNNGMTAFNPAGAGIFLALDGKRAAVALNGGPTGPVEGTEYSIRELRSFSLNESGTVALQAPLCCGPYVEGIFLARLRPPAIPNGGFEGPGDFRLPQAWTTWWTNSGTGDASQYDSGGHDSFDWYSSLRLHVGPGGGSVFVLSDPTAVTPGTTYLLESRMRFFFDAAADTAYFTVIQFDSAGGVVGEDEVLGVAGDSLWTWEPKRLLIYTAPNAAFVRYRFGLISPHEKYLDVDYLH